MKRGAVGAGLFGLYLGLMAGQLQAAQSVQVVGLFPGAAVLSVDGQRKLVKVGQTGPGGVEVLGVDKNGATLRVDGSERYESLSREYAVSGVASAAAPESFMVPQGHNGHFYPAGSINGQSVQFVVDTGASDVAMSEDDAKRIGIDYRVVGEPAVYNTANGSAQGWVVKLDSVKVGPFEVLGVRGSVMPGYSGAILLGMTYMSRVRWHEQQGNLYLESKY